MAEKKEKMVCRECDMEMNFHAYKIDYTAALENRNAMDPDFGGVMEEAHTCPGCGKTSTQEAS